MISLPRAPLQVGAKFGNERVGRPHELVGVGVDLVPLPEKRMETRLRFMHCLRAP